MIKPRQKLGKYRIERKLGDGGFAAVYKAMDTVEGVRVALKIPHERVLTEDLLEDFRQEVRLTSRLKHPHILPVKNADIIDGRFVIAYPLGERTLGERMQSRLSTSVALDFAEQMLEATAYAHSERVVHCDIKPDNLILFPGGDLMLADFGIAKIAQRTIRASGSGTLGHCAPEQAMGKPSFRSDVFSLGLILYFMLTRHLPEWPFEWPPPGADRLRGRVSKEMIQLIRRSIELNPRKRFANAGAMLTAFRRAKSGARRRRTRPTASTAHTATRKDWRTIRRRQFEKQFGKRLETRYACSYCQAPVAESMLCCPWCGADRSVHRDTTQFPLQCPRCNRGLKLDWTYCPWCYGEGFHVATSREYSDVRYTARCGNPACSRKQLMPFMRYCPWCRRKVKRKWKIEGSTDRCRSCGWGVVKAYWSYCPWCSKPLNDA